MKLENWSVVVGNYDPYTAPELYTNHLAGIVYGNPKFGEGCVITTSPIVSVDGDKVTTKSGNVYELGEVDPAYEAVYPNAKERIAKGTNS